MGDLQSAKLMYFKAALFLVSGTLSGVGILLEAFSWRVAFLLGICVWSFCRAYYFAFYVITHYIDEDFKFAGLFSFFRYLFRRNR